MENYAKRAQRACNDVTWTFSVPSGLSLTLAGRKGGKRFPFWTLAPRLMLARVSAPCKIKALQGLGAAMRNLKAHFYS